MVKCDVYTSFEAMIRAHHRAEHASLVINVTSRSIHQQYSGFGVGPVALGGTTQASREEALVGLVKWDVYTSLETME
jgi:hypothetical protein